MYNNNNNNLWQSFINFNNDSDAMSHCLATWIASQLHNFAGFILNSLLESLQVIPAMIPGSGSLTNIINFVMSHVANLMWEEIKFYCGNDNHKISHSNISCFNLCFSFSFSRHKLVTPEALSVSGTRTNHCQWQEITEWWCANLCEAYPGADHGRKLRNPGIVSAGGRLGSWRVDIYEFIIDARAWVSTQQHA